METYSTFIVGLLTAVLVSSAADHSSTNSSEQSKSKDTNDPPSSVTDYIGLSAKMKVAKRCLNEYSFTCLKMDLVKLIDRLNSKETFHIIPGLAVVKNSGISKSSSGIPPWLITDIAHGKVNSSKKLDLFFLRKLEDFIKSFSFHLQPDDPVVLRNIKNAGSEIVAVLSSPNDSRTGRSKKGALLWTAGVLAALGFAAMAALAGKALMASLLALMVSAISALRGGGSSGLAGYKTAHYEIITKPVHYSAPAALTGPAHIYDHDHLHSSSYSPGYDYARTLTAESKILTNTHGDPFYNNSNNKDAITFRTRSDHNSH